MKKNIIAAALMFGLSANAAQASLTPISSQHINELSNKIETYFIQALGTGNVDVFIQSQPNADYTGENIYLNGLLSVWQQVGNNWSLVGANDDAARVLTGTNPGSTTVYGQSVLNYFPEQTGSGTADPGLSLNLTANSKYMVVQSEYLNGPTSLTDGQFNATTYASQLNGALGQVLAGGGVGYSSAFKGLSDLSGAGSDYSFNNTYQLHVNGNVARLASDPTISSVPLPAAVWLFGSALVGFTAIGRKNTKHKLIA